MSLISGSSVTGAGGVAAYQIERSLRFNSADSAYLNRTPASSGSRTTWTWSGWVKRSALAVNHAIISCGSYSTDLFQFYFEDTTNSLRIQNFPNSVTANVDLLTSAVYRDLSAWYHIVVVMDTTQATSSNRVKLYVNGSQVTAFSTATYPAQNATPNWNTGSLAHLIGARSAGVLQYSGYMTEINFIDGQALTPSDFGETDTNTGVWKPKAYTGTYGTNGFYLSFKDNTSTTTLGYDDAGSNDWTTNNFSVTAGAGNDSLVDSPTSYGTDTGVGGEVRGNYCVMNVVAGLGNGTYSNGNLDYLNGVSATWKSGVGSLGVSSEKYYFEYTILSVSNTAYFYLGAAGSTYKNFASYVGQTSDSWGFQWNGASSVKLNNDVSTTVSTAGSISANDVIQVAIDLGTGSIWWGRNNTWVQGNPSAGTGASYTNLTGTILPAFAVYTNGGDKIAANFGQRAFAYTAPSGFKALCTQNLPTPTIGATSTTQANDYFDVTLYTGTDATQSITNSGSMQPDFVWVKARNGAYNHYLYDVIRGSTNALRSSTTGAESQAGDSTLVLQSTGFQVTGTGLGLNSNGTTIVGWQWKGGGTGVSNTAGTITSTVSANTTSGFSIVTYTGNGILNATIGHGLGVAPSMVIIKNRVGANNWDIYHISNGAQEYMDFTTAAVGSLSTIFPTTPTSSVVYLGTTGGQNTNATNYVAYCFAPVAGYSAFGSYTGNGSADGPFVYVGFRPAFLMLKRTDSTGDWMMKDFRRDGYNVVKPALFANLSDTEYSDALNLDLISNGFKLRNAFANSNANTGTYIYMAFSEFPFKYSLAE